MAGALGTSVATISTIASLTAVAAGLPAPRPHTKTHLQPGGQRSPIPDQPAIRVAIPDRPHAHVGLRIHADTYDGTAFKSEGKQDVLSFAVMLGAGGPMQEIETFRADKENDHL